MCVNLSYVNLSLCKSGFCVNLCGFCKFGSGVNVENVNLGQCPKSSSFSFLTDICFIPSFLGISIISDVFMCAIEKITSSTKEIHIAGSDPNAPADVIEVPVWNSTVANLTLMALGNY